MLKRLVFVGVCLLLSGCGESSSPRNEEDHVDAGRVRFYFPTGRPACAGTPAFLNDMLTHVADYLGLAPPERVEYHYHPDPDLSKACGNTLSYTGCSFPGETRVWSRDATSVHEIVHAVADQDGEHYSFLAEGLATALGEENVWPAQYDIDESAYLTPDALSPAVTGGIAGDFVSNLLVEFGAAQFMNLYARVPARSTTQRFKDEFRAVYQLDFDQVLAKRRVIAPRFLQNRLRFPECNLPVVEWTESQWSTTDPVDCATSGIGPSTRLASPAAAWLGENLEIAEEGIFEIAFSGSSGGARLYHCDLPQESWWLTAQDQPVLGDALGQRTLTYGRLAAGRYALLTHSDHRDDPALVTVGLRASGALQGSCPQQKPLLVPDGIDGLYLIAEPDAPTQQTFELQTARTATNEFSDAKLCDSECAACSAVPQFEARPLDAGVTYSLDVASDRYRHADGVQLAPE